MFITAKTDTKFFLGIFCVLLSFQSCNKANVEDSVIAPPEGATSPGDVGGVVDKAIGAGCAVVASSGYTFNSGSGTAKSPYYICTPQQFLNISAVKFSSTLSILDADFFEFPFMGSHFILGANIKFKDSDTEFFTLGHLRASIYRSTLLSKNQKEFYLNYDDSHVSNFVASLASSRHEFSGVLNGNGYTLEMTDYAPSQSRLFGVVALLGNGAVIKNLNIKDFNIYTRGGVNGGLLFGSLVESYPIQAQWTPKARGTKETIISDITIIDSSIHDAVANIGGLGGAARIYDDQKLTVSNINFKNVSIYGGLWTKYLPLHGDDTVEVKVNQFHNAGGLFGSVAVEGGEFKLDRFTVQASTVELKDVYTQVGRETSTGDVEYISNAELTNPLTYDMNFIYDLTAALAVQYNSKDAVWGVSNVIGSLTSISDSAIVKISNGQVIDSKAYFHEMGKAAGNLIGSLSMLAGKVDFLNLKLSGNILEFSQSDSSQGSWGIGMLAGVSTFAGSGGKYTFDNIAINGQISSSKGSFSSSIGNMFGWAGSRDEAMLADNLVSLNNIYLNGIASVAGSDLTSIGGLAGSMFGLGDSDDSDQSEGKNLISFKNIYSKAKIVTTGYGEHHIAGLVGFLSVGDYTMDNIVVDADLQVYNSSNFYKEYGINEIIGVNLATPIVKTSYVKSSRIDLESGMVDEDNDFSTYDAAAIAALKSELLSSKLWSFDSNGIPVLAAYSLKSIY